MKPNLASLLDYYYESMYPSLKVLEEKRLHTILTLKKAAAILINTQLEKSEIIRTDGNEFLIYLIGYSERQISTYCKKLTKEMKNLPHEFGAAIGFSMIEDSIKTLDDAINEATLDMINAKEDFK